ncbi:radical SAM family heme chaperone HemW [Frigidibacter sp. RF13]|uniref:radical SAM family heme chaperone HemW n=1 Tax=Frigidibacter sp. RF13 TaxID=2997340 RepID=UPI00226DBB7B|nr:radical SAM family heme chaperone HemW [Frigidibacter sp. RF13]MCY1126438.1 radical SAM family heme chaperone HemW [Frigidibacter sp. RF13]
MDDWRHGGFGLYLHWPFCTSKCPYCDFNSHVAAQVDQTRWQHAYLAEIDRIAEETDDRVLNTVFFGGGTPSLMDPDLVAAILDRIGARWRRANDFEVTLEANPGSVEAGRFRAYGAAGVNRLSMGVQALNDRDLKRLGRMHSVAEARRAFDIARDTFGRVSFDLIYARQDQALDDWRRELTEALSMAVDHFSLYQLTVEEGTVFGARAAAGHLKGLPDEDRASDMYLITQEICEAAGLPAYEISNHARPGSESRHNLIYWRYGDYAGIGPGAHGRLTSPAGRWATEAPRGPEEWLQRVETAGNGETPRELLSSSDQATEYLLMGMRLSEGIVLGRWQALRGADIPADRITGLIDLGLLWHSEGRIGATSTGRPVLNALLRELLA